VISHESIRTAKMWLHDCVSNHDKCKEVDGNSHCSSRLPTRLLRLGASSGLHDFEDLRLEIFHAPTEGRYATLSYCWGEDKFFQLKSTNIKDLEKHIQYSSLPKTMQDALVVTRALGLMYLWIDALCIIQNSSQDWKEQALIMGDIYRFSTFTIAGTAGENPFTGLNLERHKHCRKPSSVKVDVSGIPSGTYTIYDTDIWNSKVMAMPLNSRAWVLQEQLLSPRTLHFSKSEIFWECRSLKASETYPGSLPGKLAGIGVFKAIDSAAISSGKLPVAWTNRGPCPDSDLRVTYRLWRRIVSSYSKCNIKYPEDRLIAISGIARYMRRLNGDRYYAGLWRRPLIYDLLWNVPNGINHSRPITYQAPTWSWGSMNCEIEHRYLRKVGPNPLATVYDVRTEGADMGQVTNGLLILTGFAAELHFTPPTEKDLVKEQGRDINLNGTELLGGDLQLSGRRCYQPILTLDEERQDLADLGSLFFLMLFIETKPFARSYQDPYHVYGMLLGLPTKDLLARVAKHPGFYHPGTLYPGRFYTRIGLMEVTLSGKDFLLPERGGKNIVKLWGKVADDYIFSKDIYII
jgi:hypothetical protein